MFRSRSRAGRFLSLSLELTLFFLPLACKGSGVERDFLYFPGDGFGIGLGLAVRTDPGNAKPPPPGSLGELKWDGARGCYMVIDRKQETFFVLLEQRPPERQSIQRTLELLVYEAMAN